MTFSIQKIYNFFLQNLLASLNETKASSNNITKALIESKQLQKKLQEEYNAYNDIASFGSVLYFAAIEFAKTNILYSLSVAAYTKIFLKSLTSQEVS